jgi:hypothetical protein
MHHGDRFLVILCLIIALQISADETGDDGDQDGYMQADDEGEGCVASAEPTDGVFRDEENIVIFIAVGFCPRAERAKIAGASLGASIDLTLEPGGRRFQWNLAHGIDQYGVEVELPRNLPDEQYSGKVGLLAPYNLVLPVHFTKLSTGKRHLQVVFPVKGFVFGRNSQPWLQVFVRDENAQKLGVREIGYVLQVQINNTLAHTVRSANGRRVFVLARPGSNAMHLAVLNVLGEHTGAVASFDMHISTHDDHDRPPPLLPPFPSETPLALNASRTHATLDPIREASAQPQEKLSNPKEGHWEWTRMLSCPPIPAGSPALCRHSKAEARGQGAREAATSETGGPLEGGALEVCSGHGVCRRVRRGGESTEGVCRVRIFSFFDISASAQRCMLRANTPVF